MCNGCVYNPLDNNCKTKLYDTLLTLVHDRKLWAATSSLPLLLIALPLSIINIVDSFTYCYYLRSNYLFVHTHSHAWRNNKEGK